MTMTPERWQRVKALFDSALELPTDARAGWLEAELPQDGGLRDEVRALLAAHGVDPDRFETGPLISLSELLPQPEADASRVGSKAGPYRLTREIGRGGMGVVFEAYRDDDQYQKRVAVKTLFPGHDSGLILRRFRHERQILARLENPNIAALFDGGVTAEGQPYFAMELVEGQPISEYCDTRALDVRTRLTLFRQIASAVQYAHQSLVVHRDLKPGNILVTAEGTVKLLDFGIAKVLDRDGEADENLTATEVGSPHTAAYASPEQVNSQPVTTATDVFSLGVVLYQLLAGRHPFNHDRPGLQEVRRRIRDVDPVPPSDVPGSCLEQLSRGLQADLDSIVLMGLRKETTRRYSSVELFSEDVQRYLDGRPVIARPDSRSYRLGKFLGRNRPAVIAAAIAFVLLGAGVLATLWQARVARQERDRARSAAAKAEGVNRFLQNTLGAADPSWYTGGERPGPETTIGQILESAGSRAETELAATPDALADVLRTVGRANQALRRGTVAVQQLERARALHIAALGPAHPEVGTDEMELGMAEVALGNYPKAEEWMRRSLTTFRAAGDTTSDGYGRTLGNLGLVLSGVGRPAEAEPFFRASYQHRRQFDSLSPGNAILLGNIGLALSQQGKLEAAEPVYRAALAEYTRYPREYFEEGYTLGNLAVDFILRGRPDDALPLVHEQIAHFTRLLGPAHAVVGYGWVNLARVLHAKGQEAEAADAARKAERIFLASFPAEHPDLARTESILGQILASQGNLQEGERRLRHALAIRRAKLAPGSPHTADVEVALGRLLARTGRIVEAESLLSAGYRTYRSKLAPSDPRVQEVKKLLDTMP
jgi:eukaryotic-like serine/threonine-protein kinase